jgi:leader peptidase (prepilin peptidase)/N-methyltransferase
VPLETISPLTLRVLAFIFGALWGSFLNVVIYRVPRDMSVVRPRSHCPACGKPIAGWDNIPILSYVILRGKARCCGAKMSARYPLVELIGGVMAVCVLTHVIGAYGWDIPAWKWAILYLSELALALALVAAAFIDLEHMILPDEITLGGLVLGLLTAKLRGVSLVDSIASGAGAFLLIWFVFNVLYKMLRGRTGMGMGDAKLLALAGAWFGWVGLVYVLLAGAIQGSLVTLAVRLVAGKIEVPDAVKQDIEELRHLAEHGTEEEKKEAQEALANDPLAEDREGFMQAAIPFGPFLILGVLEYLFFGDSIALYILKFLLPS